MKKMPTLFVRKYLDNNKFILTDEITPGCEWVIDGVGEPTRKYDGTCCLIDSGELFARFDAKPGRVIPENAIPCQPEPDPITRHWPHWVPTKGNSQYKWHNIAYERTGTLPDGTYELCGPHFQGNPEHFTEDTFVRHGADMLLGCPRDFNGLYKYLSEHDIEGIVFHRLNGDMCKIKKSDYGLRR